MAQYLFPNHRTTDVSQISSSITHSVLSEHQDQAISAWWFYRPPCAIATGHISVQTQDRWPALLSTMCPFKDQPLGAILFR